MTETEFVNAQRTEEIRRVLSRHESVFAGKDLLEIGSGTGAQLLVLQRICRSVTGLEVATNRERLAEIVEYDGSHIPLPAVSVDVIFSSHVMEHVKDEITLHLEMHRVLRPGAVCLHIVPSAAWRLCASLAHYPSTLRNLWVKSTNTLRPDPPSGAIANSQPVTFSRWQARLSYALIQRRHGESGNWFTEHFIFRTNAWRHRFEHLGWHVDAIEPVGIASSGYCLFKERLNWPARARLAKLIGSTGILFILRSGLIEQTQLSKT